MQGRPPRAGAGPPERDEVRWAREIHDGALQELAACRMLLGAVASADAEDVPVLLDEAREALDAGIAELRALTVELRLESRPAVTLASLEALVARIASRSGVGIELGWDAAARAALADAERSHAVRRSLQEALSNVVRHAEAAHVLVRLVVSSDEHLELHVRDDGRGFDPHHTPRSGLRGMAERAAALGGTLTVVAHPGHGTRLVLRLPCRAPERAGVVA